MTTANEFTWSTLTTRRVVFLLIAACSPMAAMVAAVPLALIHGNIVLPALLAVSFFVMICFTAGYAAMSRQVVSTGALYTYVAHGVGAVPAVGAAYLAVVSYSALTLGYAGTFGYFVHVVAQALGLQVAWIWPSIAALALVAVLGFRSAVVSARVVAALLIVEFGALLTMNLGILLHKGLAALPSASFSLDGFRSSGIGIGLMAALTTFVGFETGALYGEEVVQPRRSVARATYAAVSIVGAFYVVTSWLVIGALGVDHAREEASSQLGGLLFAIAEDNVSPVLSNAMGVLMCTGVLASMLAIHNAASRYVFALGRDRLLPPVLGRFHPRHVSPHLASVTVSLISAVVVVAFAIAGLDPYLTLTTSMVGLSTLGIVLLQALSACAVVAYFMRNPSGGFLQTIVAPMFGATGLIAAFVLSAANFRSLVGTNNQFVANMPWLLGAVVIVGLLAGLWLRQGRQRGRHHASIGLDIWSGPPPTAPAATRTGTARLRRRAGLPVDRSGGTFR